MKVINLFGGPGTGKSTTAAGLFHKMKTLGYNVELVTEYAKDMTWEGRQNILSDQLYILAKQNRKLERIRDKVDYVVTDSPLILGLVYTPKDYYRYFEPLVLELWDSYENHNYYLKRSVPYQKVGRNQSEEEAKEVDRVLHTFLQSRRIPNTDIEVSSNIIDVILNAGITNSK